MHFYFLSEYPNILQVFETQYSDDGRISACVAVYVTLPFPRFLLKGLLVGEKMQLYLIR